MAYASAIFGFRTVHEDLMRSAIVIFPHGVAIAYASSLSKRKDLYKLHYLSLPLVFLPLNYDLIRYYLPVVTAYFVPFALVSSKEWKGPFKRSLELMALSYLALGAYSLYPSPNPFTDAIRLLAYPLTLIYAVSSQSFPKTFGDRANWALAFLSSSLAISALFYPHSISILVLVSLILYFASIRLYRFRDYLRKVEAMKANQIAYKANKYFLYGHLWALASVLAPFVYFNNTLALLHSLLLGFISIHIFIHFPLMVPIILRIRNKRRYNQLPFLFALASAYVWPLAKQAAWISFALSLLSLISIII